MIKFLKCFWSVINLCYKKICLNCVVLYLLIGYVEVNVYFKKMKYVLLKRLLLNNWYYVIVLKWLIYLGLLYFVL